MITRHQTRKGVENLRSHLRSEHEKLATQISPKKFQPRKNVADAVARIKSNLRLRRERNFTVGLGKDGAVHVGMKKFSKASSKTVGKVRTDWNPNRDYERPWTNRSPSKNLKSRSKSYIARKEKESMEKYKSRRREAYSQSLKQKNALSLRPNHALLKMEADIAKRGLSGNAREERKQQQQDLPPPLPEDSKLPHYMTTTEAYRIEVSARNKQEVRLRNEGRPTVHEMHELFNEADKYKEGSISASSVASVMSQIDLEASVATIKKYAKEETKKRDERRRNTLSTNIPDGQYGALPAYLRSRNAAIAEVTSSSSNDDEKDIDDIDFRTFIDIFERLCREQPLIDETSVHKRNEKIAQDEASLVRREHAWNSSSHVAEKRILSNTIFSRHDVYTHQPETASKIPKTSSLEDDWKADAMEKVKTNIEMLKKRGDLHRSRNISEVETLTREMELIKSLPVSEAPRLHDSKLHSAVSKIKDFHGRLAEACEERRGATHQVPGWRQIRQSQSEIMSEVTAIVEEMKAENKMRDSPMTKQEFEEKTFGYHVSQPIPTTRVLKKRHRYRESRDTSLNDVHHARLEEGNPPSDWWGLYGSDKHRKEVIRKDIERHMNHEIKILERDHTASKSPLSPEKLLGGEREMRAIRNHMSRMALQSSDVEGITPHEVTRAHNPDYKSALDHDWAKDEHAYLESTEAWMVHLKNGLSRHEDSTGLLLKGSQHYKAAGDATAGSMWRGQLQSNKHGESMGRAWVPTSNVHSKSALAHKSTNDQKRAIELRYKELLDQTNANDNSLTHARGVENWYQNVGNAGRRVSEKTSSSPSSSSPKKESSSKMLSPQERDQQRLERAQLRAERKATYKGLTKEEALRVGEASNKFRVDWKEERERAQKIKLLSPQERDQQRLERAQLRAERKATYKGLTKEEALRIGEASNTFRVDWDQERKLSPPVKMLSPKDREHQRLVQAAARARRREIEGGNYPGIRSPDEAKKVGYNNNFGTPKGVAFDISPK